MNTSQVQSSYSKFGARPALAGKVALLTVVGVFLLIAAGNSAAGDTTPVCHLPPGNSGNAQLIDVGSKGNAVSAHLSHGDYLPIPEICDDGLDNDCDGVIDDSDPDCPSPVSCPCEGLWNEAVNLYVTFPEFDPGWLPEVWGTCAFTDVYVTSSASFNEHSFTEETGIVIRSSAPPGDTCSARVNTSLDGNHRVLLEGSAYISDQAEVDACVALQHDICGETRCCDDP